jgi:hypothetical protein
MGWKSSRFHMNVVPERLKDSQDKVELDAGLSILHQRDPLSRDADRLSELTLGPPGTGAAITKEARDVMGSSEQHGSLPSVSLNVVIVALDYERCQVSTHVRGQQSGHPRAWSRSSATPSRRV